MRQRTSATRSTFSLTIRDGEGCKVRVDFTPFFNCEESLDRGVGEPQCIDTGIGGVPLFRVGSVVSSGFEATVLVPEKKQRGAGTSKRVLLDFAKGELCRKLPTRSGNH